MPETLPAIGGGVKRLRHAMTSRNTAAGAGMRFSGLSRL